MEPLKAVKKVLKKKQNQPQMCERSENKVPRTKVAIAIETNAFYWNIKEVSMCLNKSQTKKKNEKNKEEMCGVNRQKIEYRLVYVCVWFELRVEYFVVCYSNA